MTEVTTGSPDGGNPEGAIVSASDGSNVDTQTNPFSGLTPDNQEWITAKGFKDIDTFTKSYRELESKSGNSLSLPGKDAGQEDWDKFYSKVNERVVPKDASGYEFKLPEGLPENLPYDEDFATEFKSFALESSLPPQVAGKVHDFYVQKVAALTTAQAEAAKTALEDKASNAADVIGKEWGKEGTDKFRENSDNFAKAADGLGIKDELIAAGIITENDEVLMPKIVMALSKVGASNMFSEDTLVRGGQEPTVNVFKDPEEGQERDWAARNQLIQKAKQLPESDPERVKIRQQIKEAGLTEKYPTI